MAFYIIDGDLVEMNVDCIVANANINLKMVEGVTRAIFHKAGDFKMLEACRNIGGCKVGKAVMTPSFDMINCKAIIHAVGPNYVNGKHEEEENLTSAYQSVFDIMKENDFKSVAFPLLSYDFGYPIQECYEIAKKAILKNIKENPDFEVYMVFFKRPSKLISDEAKIQINKFLSKGIKSLSASINESNINLNALKMIDNYQKAKNINDNDLTFLANLENGYLAKIRESETFIPSLDVVMALGVGLSLNEKEIVNLAAEFGYFLQFNTVRSLIIKFFINNKEYDVHKINDYLYSFDLKILSSRPLEN